MRRFLAPAALAMTLACIGCAGTAPDYDTRVATESDYLDCQNQSLVSTGTVTDPGVAEERQSRIVDECMRHRGYTVHE
jgi:hypothetical protein